MGDILNTSCDSHKKGPLKNSTIVIVLASLYDVPGLVQQP